MMKPKLWDGPSAVGEARARFNATIDTPYQTASGPGFQADKKQDFHEVFQDKDDRQPEFLPRFYSLGQIEGENAAYTSRSVNARQFTKQGKIAAAPDEILLFYGVPNLLYMGGGWGSIVRRTLASDPVDYTILLTKDGKRFKESLTFQSVENPATKQFWKMKPGSQYRRRKSTFTWGVLINNYDGKYFTRYAFFDGATNNWTIGGTLRYTEFDCGLDVAPLAPGVLGGFNSVLCPPTGSILTTPWPFLSKSTDKGLTWSYINIDSIFSDFYFDVEAIASYNSDIATMCDEIVFLPKSPTETYFVLPFVAAAGREYRLYLWGASGVSYVSTLDKTKVNQGEGAFVSEQEAANRKVLFLEWVPKNNDGTFHHTICRSFNGGVTWQYVDKPWLSQNSGFTTWLDEDTLVCPVYDGEHSLYESKDYGDTWKKRGVIRSGWAPPLSMDDYLTSFGIVWQFRRKDTSPAAVTMGAEWVSDPSVVYVAPA